MSQKRKNTTGRRRHQGSELHAREALQEHYDKRAGDVSGWSPKAVQAKTAAAGSVVFSIRFSPSELMDLRLQAQARGLTMSELIRQAALEWGKDRSFVVHLRSNPELSVAVANTRTSRQIIEVRATHPPGNFQIAAASS